MTTKTYEEFMSEINSMNIKEALANAEKCLEAFEVRDIIKQQQETIESQKAEIERLQEIIVMGEFTSPTAVRAQQSWFRSNSEHINRLKEEIERLKSPCEMQIEVSEKIENSIKAEAVKEFVTDVINNILPKYMQGHSEQALKISLAISERVQERVGEN